MADIPDEVATTAPWHKSEWITEAFELRRTVEFVDEDRKRHRVELFECFHNPSTPFCLRFSEQVQVAMPEDSGPTEIWVWVERQWKSVEASVLKDTPEPERSNAALASGLPNLRIHRRAPDSETA